MFIFLFLLNLDVWSMLMSIFGGDWVILGRFVNFLLLGFANLRYNCLSTNYLYCIFAYWVLLIY